MTANNIIRPEDTFFDYRESDSLNHNDGQTTPIDPQNGLSTSYHHPEATELPSSQNKDIEIVNAVVAEWEKLKKERRITT